MKPPFRLVGDGLSHETVEVLEQLLALAQRGELIGIAFAGMVRQRHYFVNTAGEAHRNPTFARGMIAALDDELSDQARRELR
jgi:hypothetical protein